MPVFCPNFCPQKCVFEDWFQITSSLWVNTASLEFKSILLWKAGKSGKLPGTAYLWGESENYWKTRGYCVAVKSCKKPIFFSLLQDRWQSDEPGNAGYLLLLSFHLWKKPSGTSLCAGDQCRAGSSRLLAPDSASPSPPLLSICLSIRHTLLHAGIVCWMCQPQRSWAPDVGIQLCSAFASNSFDGALLSVPTYKMWWLSPERVVITIKRECTESRAASKSYSTRNTLLWLMKMR